MPPPSHSCSPDRVCEHSRSCLTHCANTWVWPNSYLPPTCSPLPHHRPRPPPLPDLVSIGCIGSFLYRVADHGLSVPEPASMGYYFLIVAIHLVCGMSALNWRDGMVVMVTQGHKACEMSQRVISLCSWPHEPAKLELNGLTEVYWMIIYL